MSTVVQAICPGCKQTLTIPTDWVTQAIRCKQCGMVLQAKQPARASGVRPAVSGRTPVPALRAVKPPSGVRPAVKAAPPAAIAAAAATPAYPQAVHAPVAYPQAPAAIPLAMAAAPAAGSPFDALDAEPDGPVKSSRYRRNRGGWWKGPAVVLALFLIAGVATALAWPYIRGAFTLPANPVAQADPGENEVKPPPPVDTPKAPEKSVKPKEIEGKPRDKDKAPAESAGEKDKGAKDKGNVPSKDKDTKPVETPKPPEPPKGAPMFPRRALVISVHNYLYANPVQGGLPIPGGRNISNFRDALYKGLHIPMTEMAHLSDVAGKDSRSPMKPVIEKTITDFLDSSRAQDRVMIFFVGRGVAIGDEAYLVPIEGELDNADTLIPVKWVYEQMAKCKARQKVLVVDVNRLNPGRGIERPDGGPMDAKEDAALKAPPEGVQVWTACLAGQQSYETEDSPMGVFLDRLNAALAPGKGEKGVEGKIQRPEDPLPLEALRDYVNDAMKESLSSYKAEQQSRLAGEEPKEGAAFDRNEPPAPPIVLASAPAGGDRKEVQTVLDEIGTPPIKASREDSGIRFEVLPPFPQEKMANYPTGGDETELRKAVLKARAVMWALNTAAPPGSVADEVAKVRKNLTVNLSVMKDGYRKPGDEAKFKVAVKKDEDDVADMMAACADGLEMLKDAGAMRDKETKRWQANYDFTVARLEAQYAYLYEYQSMLGQMRKQLPDLLPGQNGWQLASQVQLKGDSAGKKLAKDSTKMLEKVIKDNPGTPWEVLAKREKLTALGLSWQGAKNQ